MPEEHIFEVLGVIVRQQRSYVEVQEKMLGEYTVDEHSVFIHGHKATNKQKSFLLNNKFSFGWCYMKFPHSHFFLVGNRKRSFIRKSSLGKFCEFQEAAKISFY